MAKKSSVNIGTIFDWCKLSDLGIDFDFDSLKDEIGDLIESHIKTDIDSVNEQFQEKIKELAAAYVQDAKVMPTTDGIGNLMIHVYYGIESGDDVSVEFKMANIITDVGQNCGEEEVRTWVECLRDWAGYLEKQCL